MKCSPSSGRGNERHLSQPDSINPVVYRDVAPKDALDVFVEHRILLRQRAQQSAQESLKDIRRSYPPDLLRRFEVYFKASTQQPLISVRELKSQYIGKLVSARGIVTRATEVL